MNETSGGDEMSKLEEWKSVSHMARFSWKLTTTQVADAADAAIAELEAALAERDMMLKRLYLWDGIETAADGPLVKTATKVVIRRTRQPS